MKSKFNGFLEQNKELIQKYDKKILKVVFSNLVSALNSSNEREIPLIYLVETIKNNLSKKKISVLNLEQIVKVMMDFLSPYYGFEEDSYDNHRAEAKKALWRALIRYTSNPSNYIKELFDDIVYEFETSGYISSEEISRKLQSNEKYGKLPPEAIDDCVSALFDLFVSKGFIQPY